MVQRILKALMSVAIIVSLAGTAFAQNSSSTDMGKRGGPRRQLATIIFAGLGGAVLGLSTLSFYGRPQDNLSNIAVGFAVGVITGTTYVTYKAATRPSEFYGHKPLLESEELFSMRRSADSFGLLSQNKPIQLSWKFEF
jgi:hypothetical protein